MAYDAALEPPQPGQAQLEGIGLTAVKCLGAGRRQLLAAAGGGVALQLKEHSGVCAGATQGAGVDGHLVSGWVGGWVGQSDECMPHAAQQ
jgi:hypothetical protein